MLLRASARHDGRLFAPWIAAVTALPASSVLVYPWIFETQAERAALATAVGANPALGLIFGPAFDLSTADGFNDWRALGLGGFIMALGAILTVTRIARGQEDSGQAELLASGVVGRWGRLASAVGLALGGCLVAGVASGLATVACGGGWANAFLLSATFTATGFVFTALAAVTSGLGADARSANSMAIGVLGALFLLRGFAYAVEAPRWTVWANPLGWMTEVRPATGAEPWPLAAAAGLATVLVVVAFRIQARRDFGQGAIAPRPGSARGRVRSSLALALRVGRGQLIVWAIAFVVLGLVFGYFVTSIGDLLQNNAAVARILAAGATTHEQLASRSIATILAMIGIYAAIPGVQVMTKFRSEELADRVEPVLAGAVSRFRCYGSHVLVALVAPAVYLAGAGVIVAAVAASTSADLDFGQITMQALVTIPAVWAPSAVAVAVIGARPHVVIAAWVGVLLSFVLTLLGPTFNLWDWVLAISPFRHVPKVTDSDATWMGLGIVCLVAAAFTVIGLVGFRRRDIAV